MSTPRTVVVTGVSGRWGRQVAQRLLAQPELRVLGVDRRPPEQPLPRLDFVKADVRNPLLVDLLRIEGVDSVVHLAWRDQQWRNDRDFESNVLGTMQLVGACADAGVRQVVLKSTMAVYGASSESSMYLPESAPLKARSAYGHILDALEMERFVREFSAEYPEMHLAVLRFANVVGPRADTPFTRLLRLPVIPELLGFDPLFQVVDAEDAIAALVHAVLVDAAGPFNVAADGVLSLCQVAGMVGRPVVPVLHLALYWSWPLLSAMPLGRSALGWLPIEPDYLRYPWTGDLARMWDELAFEPQRDAHQVIEHFVQASRVSRYENPAELRRFADDRLDETIARRRGSQAARDDAGLFDEV